MIPVHQYGMEISKTKIGGFVATVVVAAYAVYRRRSTTPQDTESNVA
jgi:hypothetical protein